MQSRLKKRKIDRKRDFCLNCNHPMPDDYNFCPVCGQENIDNRAAIGMLAEEFINTFFAYDSRFLRSIIPFLFRPGFLTNQFLLGRRLSYVHPLRLYLVVSLIYFTIISLEINVKGNLFQSNSDYVDTNESLVAADSLQAQVKNDLAKDSVIIQAETHDSIRKKKPIPEEDVIINLGDFDYEGKDESFNLTNIRKWSQDPKMTPAAVLDSLGREKTYWNLKIAEQTMKVIQRDTGALVEYFLGKTSLMMFMLLPFFAVLLKLFYIRSKRYYIEHLVFTLHIHSFLFFVTSGVVLIMEVYDNNSVIAWAALILFVYMLFSFRNVYKQGWIKTLVKMFVLFHFHVISLVFFLIATVILSFLLY
ncbi:MAG: DUF3667 domain-containing protein [Bacteroidota bacterium]